MPDNSSILSLPYIQPSQAQKHVTHNEALRALDVIVQLSVKSRSISDPPAAAVDGDRYIIGSGATAEWAGREGQIAAFLDGIWDFFAPLVGWAAYVADEGETVTFQGSNWAVPVLPSELQNMTAIGVNATADLTNRLAIAAPATLLNHEGAGHQLKVNKNATGDSASVLFQTNWSGRAEFGTVGTDDFAIKVSADGSGWATAIKIDSTSGVVSFPSGGVRERLGASRTYYIDPVAGDDGNDGLFSGTGAFASIGRAIAAVESLDAAGHEVTISLADGTYALSQTVELGAAFVGLKRLHILGNTSTPGAVVLSSAAADALSIQSGDATLQGVSLAASGTGAAVSVGRGASVSISDVEFGATVGNHLRIDGGRLEIDGDVTILGGAARHFFCEAGGQLIASAGTVALSGTPDFSAEFGAVDGLALADLSGIAFSGSATGPRYAVTRNGVVDTGAAGAGFLPGDSAGTVATGGQYL
ncbi:DUF2793 domain-containing protein [Aliiroseovarius sp. YM-037]|uniref:DUF2793 domain-containing protein n=1 Tax=Aliiroseovarius sp. YM-037 TaxID=3341728 RepID=UPI003A800015